MSEAMLLGSFEDLVETSAGWLRLAAEFLGVSVIAVGIVAALSRAGLSLATTGSHDFNALRLSLGRYLIVALEFQLAADLLGTVVAPTWDQLGKLAVVAALRTILSWFLTRELHSESARAAASNDSPFRWFDAPAAAPSTSGRIPVPNAMPLAGEAEKEPGSPANTAGQSGGNGTWPSP